MKRNFIIRNIIIVVLVIAIIVGVSVYFIYKNAREYEVEQVSTYNYFVLEKDELSGVIDRGGNIIIDPQFDSVVIPNPEKALYICYEEENTKVLNERKEEILTDYNNVEPIGLQNISSDLMYEKSVLKYEKDGKFGLIDFNGKEITKPVYESIEGLPYKEGELLVKQDEKYGVINIKGNKLVDIKYNKISVDGYYTSENNYKFAGYIISNTTEEGYRYGYIKYDGKLLLEPEYNQLSRVIGIIDNQNLRCLLMIFDLQMPSISRVQNGVHIIAIDVNIFNRLNKTAVKNILEIIIVPKINRFLGGPKVLMLDQCMQCVLRKTKSYTFEIGEVINLTENTRMTDYQAMLAGTYVKHLVNNFNQITQPVFVNKRNSQINIHQAIGGIKIRIPAQSIHRTFA